MASDRRTKRRLWTVAEAETFRFIPSLIGVLAGLAICAWVTFR